MTLENWIYIYVGLFVLNGTFIVSKTNLDTLDKTFLMLSVICTGLWFLGK